MTSEENDIIYSDDYCIIVPEITFDLLEAFQYTFKNVIPFKKKIEEYKKSIEIIKNSSLKRIILVDYQPEYEKIIKEISKNIQIDFIFTGSLANFSYEPCYQSFKTIIKKIEKINKSKLAVLDRGLYEVLKKEHENVAHILLDIPRSKAKPTNNNTVGILNTSNVPVYSYYNELTAIKLLDGETANIKKCDNVTKKFLKDFKIDYKAYDRIDEIIHESEINLYINFTNTKPILFLKSMDAGIPCILGNSDLLDENEYLKKMLIVKSDDDVNEIASIILEAKKNKKKILEEYKKFRDNYIERVKTNNKIFIQIDDDNKDKKYEKLLSVVVPVYNTEKYLLNTINSIINARIDNMEILIINDGSTDNCEIIIKKFLKEYPDLIRYIKKENGGLGSVRNVGLKEAKGKYISSIDSDDTINSNFFKEAEVYLKRNIDVVIYDWLSINEDNSEYETPAIEESLKEKSKYEGILYSSIMPSTCNKIIKKSILDSLNMKYVEDKYEDLSLNPLVMLKAKTIKYINKPYYEYYLRSGSLMRTSAGYSMIHIIKELNERINNIGKVNANLEEFKYYTYSWRIEEYIFNQLYFLDEKEIDDYVDAIYKDVYNICISIFNSDYYKKMLKSISDKELIEFINKRNKAFKDKKLKEFLIGAKKNGIIRKLNSLIIYYGDKK